MEQEQGKDVGVAPAEPVAGPMLQSSAEDGERIIDDSRSPYRCIPRGQWQPIRRTSAQAHDMKRHCHDPSLVAGAACSSALKQGEHHLSACGLFDYQQACPSLGHRDCSPLLFLPKDGLDCSTIGYRRNGRYSCLLVFLPLTNGTQRGGFAAVHHQPSRPHNHANPLLCSITNTHPDFQWIP